MNKRERIMVLAVASLVLLFIGRTATKKYFGTLAEKNVEILVLEKRLVKIHADQRKALDNQNRWLQIGRQTLSMDPNDVTARLRDELYELTKKCNLTETEIDLGGVNPWQKNGVRVLGGTLTAKGTMNEMVAFLYELYQAPYLVRCRSLTLNQVGGKAPLGSLKLIAKLETLILPSNAKVSKITPAVLDKEKRKPVDRTELAQLDDYKSMVEKKMWEKFVPPPPRITKASNPNPPVGGNVVGSEVNLTWTPAPEATAHNVYLGTSPPGELVATTQPATNLQRTDLKPGTTYFWRVDEVFADGPVTGDQWNFRTEMPPPVVTKATNPGPPVGGSAGPEVNLTWTPGAGATAHQIYFGTSPATLELVATQPQPTLMRTDLAPGTMYYWRVDEVLPDGVATGDPWSFTTVTPPPPPPPADSALVVARVLSSPRGQQAVLIDPAQQGNPMAVDKRVYLGEPLYGGTLVYVHPKGVVSELNGALRFHALGEALQQGQPLTEETQPEVFHEVRKLEAQAAGISQSPG